MVFLGTAWTEHGAATDHLSSDTTCLRDNTLESL